MKIKHSPIFDTDSVEKKYSEKDGVPVKYVCTSAIDNGTVSADIFYHEEPHPDFGNRYFGLYMHENLQPTPTVMIFNADKIEDVDIVMIEGPEGWEYSQDRWDFRRVGETTIDGGRAYTKLLGDISVPIKTMKVVDGEFVELEDES
jgi:hypothetical protein